MTALPPALARWSRELAGLPPELIAALAPWLGRLSIAIGPLGSPRGAPTGELDGVDGLDRRGSYERLLMTEWAIGLELPDEFLRRAGSGEHLFVAQARRQPAAARRSVVIVSAGPAQLGAPRLVHLAALVVLARRAAAGDAELAWGVLEQPAEGLLDGADPAALERLLGRRTVLTATRAHADAWAARLGAVDGDRWVIGDGAAAASARPIGAGLLRVHDPLELGVAAIDVEVTPAGATTPRARVRLQLPQPDEAARLIRDPFRRGVAASAGRAATGALDRLWFVPGSKRLAVETGGRTELWPIPSSPRESPGHPRRVPMTNTGGSLVALGARRRVPVIVTWHPSRPDVLSLEDARLAAGPIRVALPRVVVDVLASGRAAARATPGAAAYLDLRPVGQRRRSTLVIDGPCGALLAVDEPEVGATTATSRLLGLDEDFEETEVLGAAVYEEGMVFAALRPGGEVQLREVSRRGVHVVATTARRGFAGTPDDPGVHFGFRMPSLGGWGPVAVRIDDTHWDVITATGIRTLHQGGPVVGVLERDGAPALVMRAPNRRRLSVDDHPMGRLVAGGDILAVTVATSLAAVAWATASEIVVYSLAHDAALLRVPRAEASR